MKNLRYALPLDCGLNELVWRAVCYLVVGGYALLVAYFLYLVCVL